MRAKHAWKTDGAEAWGSAGSHTMAEQLKPIGKIYLITDLPECEWYQGVKEGELLYAIPPTHRVVSVELLEEIVFELDLPSSIIDADTLLSKLRAIIDNKEPKAK